MANWLDGQIFAKVSQYFCFDKKCPQLLKAFVGVAASGGGRGRGQVVGSNVLRPGLLSPLIFSQFYVELSHLEYSTSSTKPQVHIGRVEFSVSVFRVICCCCWFFNFSIENAEDIDVSISF